MPFACCWRSRGHRRISDLRRAQSLLGADPNALLLASRSIKASEGQVRQLATEFDATPGVVAGAAAARLGDGSLHAVRNAVRALLDCDKS